MVYGKSDHYRSFSRKRAIPLSLGCSLSSRAISPLWDSRNEPPQYPVAPQLRGKSRPYHPLSRSPYIAAHLLGHRHPERNLPLGTQPLLERDGLTPTEVYLNLSLKDVIRKFQVKVIPLRSACVHHHREVQYTCPCFQQDLRGRP